MLTKQQIRELVKRLTNVAQSFEVAAQHVDAVGHVSSPKDVAEYQAMADAAIARAMAEAEKFRPSYYVMRCEVPPKE